MAFSTETVGRVHHYQMDYEMMESEAVARFRSAARERAHANFESVAAELAGPDETLRRVLLARLVDAHLQGYFLAGQEDHFRFDYWQTGEGAKWIEKGRAPR